MWLSYYYSNIFRPRKEEVYGNGIIHNSHNFLHESDFP